MGNQVHFKYFHHRGFIGEACLDTLDKTYFGSVSNIAGDVVTFRSDEPGRLEVEFKLSVDDYLKFCEENGREPAPFIEHKIYTDTDYCALCTAICFLKEHQLFAVTDKKERKAISTVVKILTNYLREYE